MNELTTRLLHRKNNRNAIGWVDFSRDSWDFLVATAEAYRIIKRRNGVRITIQQAIAAFR